MSTYIVNYTADDIDCHSAPLTLSYFDVMSGDTISVCGFIEQDRYLYLPRHYAKDYEPDAVFLTHTGNSIRIPCNVTLRDHQRTPVSAILNQFTKRTDVPFKAATGKGKTVMACYVAAKLGVSTVIIVDQRSFIKQWKDTLVNLLGVDENLIGIYGGKKKEIKPITIAMVQTLSRHDMKDEFYSNFGLSIYDEAHTTGTAKTYLKTLMYSTTRYRLLLSATLGERNDVYEDLFFMHCGPIRVVLEDKHIESEVRVILNRSKYPTEGESVNKSLVLKHTTTDYYRNSLIVKAAQILYKEGHTILILSDRIEQLKFIEYGLNRLGITDCALCTTTDHDYSGSKVKKKTLTEDTISSRIASSRIILSTFSYFEKGKDVPRISAGIDASPRQDAKQAHGRILRTMENKLKPVWATIRDVYNNRCEYALLERLKDYKEDNVSEWYIWDSCEDLKNITYLDLRKEIQTNLRYLKSTTAVLLPNGDYKRIPKPDCER